MMREHIAWVGITVMWLSDATLTCASFLAVMLARWGLMMRTAFRPLNMLYACILCIQASSKCG